MDCEEVKNPKKPILHKQEKEPIHDSEDHDGMKSISGKEEEQELTKIRLMRAFVEQKDPSSKVFSLPFINLRYVIFITQIVIDFWIYNVHFFFKLFCKFLPN